MTVLDALVFGSLISATDPVATLGIFHAMQVDDNIQMIVFGESAINDAIAIALFRTFTMFEKKEDYSPTEPLILFLYLFFGSILIGVCFSPISALFFKFLTLRKHSALEFSLFMLLSFIPFFICEATGLSGVLAVFFSGMVMGHYTWYNLSQESKITVEQTVQTLRFVAETFCFAYLGMSIPFVVPHIRTYFALTAFGVLLLSRAASVFPLSSICNLFMAKKIEFKHQIAVWWTGLRGAVAFAMAMSFPGPARDIVIATTMILVCGTVIVLGGLTIPLLKILRLDEKEDEAPQMVMSRHGNSIHSITHPTRNEPPILEPATYTFMDRLEYFDKHYMQAWFRRTQADDSEEDYLTKS